MVLYLGAGFFLKLPRSKELLVAHLNMFDIDIFKKWTPSSQARQIFASISCYLCEMTSSLTIYWLSPYTIKWTSGDNPMFTPTTLAMLIAVLKISEAATSLATPYFSDRFGRKTTLLAIGPLPAVLWMFSTFTKDTIFLVIIRILQGIAVGVAGILASVYVAEIAAAKRRGFLCGFYSIFWNIGLLYEFINSDYLSFDVYTFTLIVVPFLFCVTFIFMPESPHYYFMNNQPEKAKVALEWLRYGEDIVEEYMQIQEAVEEDMRNAGSWKDLIATKKDRRALFIVQIVCLSRYLVGINILIAFTEDVFAKSGQILFTANQQSMSLLLLNTVSSFVASFFSDTFGRRKMLIYSLIGTAISNIIIAVYFCLLEVTSLQVIPYVWVMYVGVVGLCVCTNIGVVPIMPAVKVEFFPSHTRSKGSAVTCVISAVACFVQLCLFPVIYMYIGMYFNFITFAVISVIAILLIICYLPESAGKTLAEVNQSVQEITSV